MVNRLGVGTRLALQMGSESEYSQSFKRSFNRKLIPHLSRVSKTLYLIFIAIFSISI